MNNAGAAGAIAAVISGNITGLDAYRPLFLVESAIPALILVQAEIGEQLSAMSQQGEVTLSVRIDTEELESRNVVAELAGSGDALVVVGGPLRRCSADRGWCQRQHIGHCLSASSGGIPSPGSHCPSLYSSFSSELKS